MFMEAQGAPELEKWMNGHYRKRLPSLPIRDQKNKPYIHKRRTRRRQIHSYVEDESHEPQPEGSDEFQANYWLHFSNVPEGYEHTVEQPTDEKHTIDQIEEAPVKEIIPNDIAGTWDQGIEFSESKLTRAEQVIQNRFFNREYQDNRRNRLPIGSSPLRFELIPSNEE